MRTQTPHTTEQITTLEPGFDRPGSGAFDLTRFRPWLIYVAAQMRPRRDPMHEDLVQEGAIAMWKAHLKYDPKRGNYDQHLRVAARCRMLDIASQRKKELRPPELQNRGAKEPKREALRTYEVVVERTPAETDTPADNLLHDRTAPSTEERFEEASIRQDVWSTINRLPLEHREAVLQKFYDRPPEVPLKKQKLSRLWLEAQDELAYQLQHVSDGYGDRT